MGLGRRQNAGVLALISFDAPSAPLLDRLCSDGVLPRLTESARYGGHGAPV